MNAAIIVGAVCAVPVTIVLTLEAERCFDGWCIRICRAVIRELQR